MEDNRRYYGLDALRGSMMMLGIVLHGSQWYLTEPPGGIPMPTDQSTAYFFDVVVHVIHSFRMPLFFLLAGFFCSLLVEKRGIKATYINRGKRVLGPFLVACLTILPLTVFFLMSFMVNARYGTYHALPEIDQLLALQRELQEGGFPADKPSFGHLWFLYYLLYFYLLIPLCKVVVSGMARFERTAVLASPLMYLALGLLTTVTLWPFRGGVLFEGFIFIEPHLPSLVYYGLFFVLGYMIHHHKAMLGTFTKYTGQFWVISLVLIPLAIYTTALDLDATSDQRHLIAVIVNGFLTWSLIYGFMGAFLRFLDYDSPWILYVSNSSYWVYLIHMPVVCFAAWFMLPFDVSAYLKFGIVITFTTVLCLLSYQYLIQRSAVSSLLNGMRFDHPWPWKSPR